jgi:transcriptional regulator with XRE-family HTH domain
VNIPARLRLALDTRGITQRELARKLGVTEGAISNYMSGLRTPGLIEIEAIARAIGMPPEELMGWHDRAAVAIAEGLAIHQSIPEQIDHWRQRALAAEKQLALIQTKLKALLADSEKSSPPPKPKPAKRRSR